LKDYGLESLETLTENGNANIANKHNSFNLNIASNNGQNNNGNDPY
jgi:hypothetical protein